MNESDHIIEYGTVDNNWMTMVPENDFYEMTSLDEELFEAVIKNNSAKVKQLLEQGVDVNQLLPSGWSLLGHAVRYGEISTIRELLRSTPLMKDNPSDVQGRLVKCDVNIKDHFERTPLHYAAENGQTEVVSMLIVAGSRANVSDRENVTPLHLAVGRGHDKIVKVLLEAGTEVNRKTSDKSSALHLASSRGYSEMVDLLLHFGAKVDALDSIDRTPLFLAVSRSHYDVAKILIQHGAKVNIEEIHGYTPLAEAVWHKDTELVHLLLDAGAKITKSLNLLHYCVLHRNTQLMELLLCYGCLVNVLDDNGDAPLHIAARTGELKSAEMLIKHGASVNYRTRSCGTTPLHEAIREIRDNEVHKFSALLRLFINHNCLLATESFMHFGDTPLFRAILNDRFQIAAILIRHGADVNVGHLSSCNIDNLCLAQQKQNFLIVKLLVFAGFNLRNTPWLEILPSALPHSYHPHTLKGWVIHMKRNPMNLVDLCRVRFRRQLGSRVYPVVEVLPLPQRIKRYLLLEDIDA